jgi:hypothetical protein
MIINDINYIETVEAKEVQGGLSFSEALASASAIGRGMASTYTSTKTLNVSQIGVKIAYSSSVAGGQADV